MYEFILPDLGEGIHEGELIKWYVEINDTIKEDEPLCDIETDKATVTIPSPRTGKIVQLNGKPGEVLIVGTVIVVIEETGEITKGQPSEKTSQSENLDIPQRKKAIAAPATRKLAREMGIDINQVPGSGPGGRVTKEDLEHYNDQSDDPQKSIESFETTEKPPSGSDFAETKLVAGGIPFFELQTLPDFSEFGPVEKVPIQSIRKKTATKTTTSMILIPHVAHMEECDVTELEALRNKYNQSKADKSFQLTLMAFVIKALSSLLKNFKPFNASVDPNKLEIIYKNFINIGFAADTPKGLMVPVIKNTDTLSVAGIGRMITTLAQKARQGEITISEMNNGTFTVTNVGAIGGTGMLPTINYPESAILGLGRASKKPIVIDDAIVIRKMLPMTLSFDHRVADGVQAATFISQLKQMLEDPVHFMTQI